MVNLWSTHVEQYGLKWVKEPFDTVPTWTVEPRIDIIKELALPHLPVADYKVEYFASGSFNKLYLISSDFATGADTPNGREEYLMRVALPVHPYFKTASEVATLSYLANHTSIPVPHVLAHNSCASDGALGFEWILMTRLRGVPLESLWSSPSLSWSDRLKLTNTLAGYIDQMRMIRSPFLGNLYFSHDADDVKAMLATRGKTRDTPFEILEETPKYSVGPICAIPFFYDNRIHLASDLGPWRSAHAWITAQIRLLAACANATIEGFTEDVSFDEDDMEECRGRVASAEALLSLLANTNRFNLSSTPSPSDQETFVLYHGDLSTNNILVDPITHKITGIVDWECVSFVPLWKANIVPKLVDGPDIDSIAYQFAFGPGEVPHIPPPPDENDDDSMRIEFRNRLEQYRLRDPFVRTLSVSLCPEGCEQIWGRGERVLERQVELLDIDGLWKRVGKWVVRIQAGEPLVPEHSVGDFLYIWPEM